MPAYHLPMARNRSKLPAGWSRPIKPSEVTQTFPGIGHVYWYGRPTTWRDTTAQPVILLTWEPRTAMPQPVLIVWAVPSGNRAALSSAPVTVLSCCTNPDSPFPARAPRSDVEYDRCTPGPGPGHPLADRRSCHTIDSLFCPISVLDPSLHIIQPVTFLSDRPHPGLRDVETGPGPIPSNQCVFYTAATRRAESN
jgi:hypothetical protein